MEKYNNDDITYSVNAPKPQFAVLSEVYYSRGWNAYADGKLVPIVKTDYVLRGVALPAGTKKLELKFEPQSYKMGSTITTLTSGIILLLLALGVFFEFFRKKKTEEAA
ncbi:MAG TPA: YfhO family protein [Phnomibacter sp.]|nr:YfhO family protein [Phnomibacter sp.]